MSNDKPQSIDPRDAGNIASRHYSRRPTTPTQPWTLKDPEHPIDNVAFIKAITEITVAFRAMMDCASSSDPHENERVWDVSLSAIRQMSVSIRKLLLDNEGKSIKQAISEPLMYPPGGEKYHNRELILSFESPYKNLYLNFENGKQNQGSIPEKEYKIHLGRLYGVAFLEDGYAIYSPFDYSAPPISLKEWLSLKVLQVNSVGYTIEDLLRLGANFEGAHCSSNFPAFIGGGSDPEQLDAGPKMKWQMVKAAQFGEFLYPDLFVLFTSVQFIDQIQDLVRFYMQGSVNNQVPDAILKLKNQVHDLQTKIGFKAPFKNHFCERASLRESGLVYGPGRSWNSYRIWSGSKDWDA